MYDIKIATERKRLEERKEYAIKQNIKDKFESYLDKFNKFLTEKGNKGAILSDDKSIELLTKVSSFPEIKALLDNNELLKKIRVQVKEIINREDIPESKTFQTEFDKLTKELFTIIQTAQDNYNSVLGNNNLIESPEQTTARNIFERINQQSTSAKDLITDFSTRLLNVDKIRSMLDIFLGKTDESYNQVFDKDGTKIPETEGTKAIETAFKTDYETKKDITIENVVDSTTPTPISMNELRTQIDTALTTMETKPKLSENIKWSEKFNTKEKNIRDMFELIIRKITKMGVTVDIISESTIPSSTPDSVEITEIKSFIGIIQSETSFLDSYNDTLLADEQIKTIIEKYINLLTKINELARKISSQNNVSSKDVKEKLLQIKNGIVGNTTTPIEGISPVLLKLYNYFSAIRDKLSIYQNEQPSVKTIDPQQKIHIDNLAQLLQLQTLINLEEIPVNGLQSYTDLYKKFNELLELSSKLNDEYKTLSELKAIEIIKSNLSTFNTNYDSKYDRLKDLVSTCKTKPITKENQQEAIGLINSLFGLQDTGYNFDLFFRNYTDTEFKINIGTKLEESSFITISDVDKEYFNELKNRITNVQTLVASYNDCLQPGYSDPSALIYGNGDTATNPTYVNVETTATPTYVNVETTVAPSIYGPNPILQPGSQQKPQIYVNVNPENALPNVSPLPNGTSTTDATAGPVYGNINNRFAPKGEYATLVHNPESSSV